MAELTPDEQKKLQQTIIELENSRSATEILREQINILASSINEIMATTETIKGIRKLEPGTEILVPIGSDSFLRAKITETDRVVSGLGADVMVERESERAISALEEQRKEFEQSIGKAREELERLTKRIEELRPEVERLMAKVRKE